MADLTKCKKCRYYHRAVSYVADPRGVLYDACNCAPHWFAEIGITLKCPIETPDKNKQEQIGGENDV